MTRRRRLSVVVVVAAAAAAVPATTPAATTVRVGDNFFKPKRVTVERGSTVRWRFVGDNPHNVTVTRGPVRFSSSTRRSGSYRRRLDRRGTYRIICTVHGRPQRMRLVVR